MEKHYHIWNVTEDLKGKKLSVGQQVRIDLHDMTIEELPELKGITYKEFAKGYTEGNYTRVYIEIIGTQTREEYYNGVEIGFKTLTKIRKDEADRNGATFNFTKFQCNGAEYYAIEREGQGWKSGKEYEVQDQYGMVVDGFYNKENNKRSYLNMNDIKNRKTLINKFKESAENFNIEIQDSYYHSVLN